MAARKPIAERFQSLLLWNGGADNAGGPPAANTAMFQSLLLWNGGADVIVITTLGPPRLVSILVVVERGGGLESG